MFVGQPTPTRAKNYSFQPKPFSPVTQPPRLPDMPLLETSTHRLEIPDILFNFTKTKETKPDTKIAISGYLIKLITNICSINNHQGMRKTTCNTTGRHEKSPSKKYIKALKDIQ